MTSNKVLAESIRNYLESGVDLLLTNDDYRTIIKALEQEPILCKECENYYFADNRIPEQQCYVCDYWDDDNPEPTGYCNHAVRKSR